MSILKGAEPFILKGGNTGILLVHGFTGSPAEIALLGEFLHNHQYTVMAPRLTGHGTSVEDLEHTTKEDWYNSVVDAYHLLKNCCNEIHVMGLSMGGLLAIKLSLEFNIKKVLVMSTPFNIITRGRELPPKEYCQGQFIPKLRREFSVEPKYLVAYNQMPLLSIHQLFELVTETKNSLPKFNNKILIMQSKKDHTIKVNSAECLYQNIASTEKKIVWLEESGHVITLDKERDIVFKEALRFIQK